MLLALFLNLSLILVVVKSSDYADKYYNNKGPYVTKCCDDNEIVKVLRMVKSCVAYDGVLNYTTIPIYNEGLEPTRKRVGVDISAAKVWNLNEKMAINLKFLPGLIHYLMENGVLQVESPNDYERWFTFNNSEYCFDFVMTRVNNEFSLMLNWWVVFNEPTLPVIQDTMLQSAAMLVSSFFLAMVLIVYAILPPLKSLSGFIVIFYAFSQLGAYLSLGILQLLQHLQMSTINICLSLSPAIYFFFLAAFCWMNVMSFDIWRTFSGYNKERSMQRRCGEKLKFGGYCAYAFGLPGAMTAMFVTLLYTDMTRWPWFITPAIPRKGCFLERGELFLYLYVPMLIVIISNWLLFLMTVFKIWRLSRANAEDSRRSHKQIYMLYLKLSIVMGISWITEVLSALRPDFVVWRVTDLYNSLIGLFVFIIFVCNRTTLRMLKKRRSCCFNRCKQNTDQHFDGRVQSNTCPGSVSTGPAALWLELEEPDV